MRLRPLRTKNVGSEVATVEMGGIMAKHPKRNDLLAGLPHILASPADEGVLEAMVVRPTSGERIEPTNCSMSSAGGLDGDHWAKGCWKTTDDGAPHPDVQICIMNTRCIGLIAQERENWAPTGDNLFIDMGLTPDNIAPGQRLSIGSVVIEITDTPHKGCAKFVERYGRQACAFGNVEEGDRYKLREIYARVVQDGRVTIGDTVRKIG